MLSRKEVADRVDSILEAYLETQAHPPRSMRSCFAAAVWLVQENHPCQGPMTQDELAKMFNINQPRISVNAEKIRTALADSGQAGRL